MPRRALWKRAWKPLAALIFLALALDYTLYPRFGTRAPQINAKRNALWLHFDWARGKSSESVRSLAARMKANGLRDAYFHVRYIGKSGRLRFRDPKAARRLNAEMKVAAPGVRRIAWLYIGNARGITGVDISKPEIRANIAHETGFLTRDCGFDGVQIDYEICADGDRDFLLLLREIRAATPGKVLCVATPMWLPAPLGISLGAWGWSENYFAQVAQGCDQIVVMAYDSALYFPRHYVWLIEQQVVRVPRAAKGANPNCEVLLGVPSYEEGGPSHWNGAENLAMAMRGARQAWTRNPKNQRLDGIALFADYSTDQGEWEVWRRSFTPSSNPRHFHELRKVPNTF